MGFLFSVKYKLQEIGLKNCEANNFWMRGFLKACNFLKQI